MTTGTVKNQRFFGTEGSLAQAVSPEREVITMAITISELIQFVIMLTGIISLCYLIFNNKNK